MNEFQVVTIIPAAGTGQRMNAGVNKIWLKINGQIILDHVLKVFTSLDLINHIVLVTNRSEIKDLESFVQENWDENKNKISVVIGGKERHDSVAYGLRFLKNWPGWFAKRRIVVIHDAARALLTPEILQRSIEACLIHHAVGVAVPVKDTIKQIDPEGFVLSTPDRSFLWTVQTPQVFDFDMIFNCYEQVVAVNHKFTDDCSVAEYCGYHVKLVEGSYENFKITTSEDLILAETIMRRRTVENRTGV